MTHWPERPTMRMHRCIIDDHASMMIAHDGMIAQWQDCLMKWIMEMLRRGHNCRMALYVRLIRSTTAWLHDCLVEVITRWTDRWTDPHKWGCEDAFLKEKGGESKERKREQRREKAESALSPFFTAFLGTSSGCELCTIAPSSFPQLYRRENKEIRK